MERHLAKVREEEEEEENKKVVRMESAILNIVVGRCTSVKRVCVCCSQFGVSAACTSVSALSC